MWGRLRGIPAAHPLAFGAGFTCVKTTAADVFVQTALEGRDLDSLDLKRTAVYGTFGLLYMGCVQYAVYVKGACLAACMKAACNSSLPRCHGC